jgi:hypothetical protein
VAILVFIFVILSASRDPAFESLATCSANSLTPHLTFQIIGQNGFLDPVTYRFRKTLSCRLSFRTSAKGLKYLFTERHHLLVDAHFKYLNLLLHRCTIGDMRVSHILHLGKRLLTLLPNSDESSIHFANTCLSALLK